MAARREAGRIDYRIGHLPADERVAAVRRLAADGLAAHVATLLAVATYEDDVAVIDALADAVAARQWEPVTNDRMAALRLWARGWLQGRRSRRAARRRRRRRGRPRRSCPPFPPRRHPAAPSRPRSRRPRRDGDPLPDARGPRMTAVPPLPLPRPAADLPLPCDGAPTGAVLVTGAGGPAGVAVHPPARRPRRPRGRRRRRPDRGRRATSHPGR